MTFEKLTSCVPCTVCARGEDYESAEVKSLVISDLMSDVLTTTEEGFVIVTSLNSDQVVHTADVVGALGVLLVNGKQPQADMKALAEENGIALFSTPWNSFQVCMTLGRVIEKEGA